MPVTPRVHVVTVRGRDAAARGSLAAVKAMLSAVAEAKVEERCDRTGRAPSCRFVLARQG
jgi:hypothetical protein